MSGQPTCIIVYVETNLMDIVEEIGASDCLVLQGYDKVVGQLWSAWSLLTTCVNSSAGHNLRLSIPT